MMQLPASNLLPSLRLILRSNVQIMCTASHYTTKRQHQRSASSSSARRAPHRFNKDRHKTAAGMQAIPSRIAEPKTHRPTGSHLLITSQEPFANISKYGNQLLTNMEVGKASYNRICPDNQRMHVPTVQLLLVRRAGLLLTSSTLRISHR